MPYLEIDSLGRKVVSRVENYANYHPGFGGLLRGETVKGILAQLSGEKMWLMKEKINVSGEMARGSQACGHRELTTVFFFAVQARSCGWI